MKIVKNNSGTHQIQINEDNKFWWNKVIAVHYVKAGKKSIRRRMYEISNNKDVYKALEDTISQLKLEQEYDRIYNSKKK